MNDGNIYCPPVIVACYNNNHNNNNTDDVTWFNACLCGAYTCNSTSIRRQFDRATTIRQLIEICLLLLLLLLSSSSSSFLKTSVGIFPRKKKLMKKIKVWSRTNPGGRKKKKPSCKSTALKRWMATEMRWNKNWGSLSSPLTSEIRQPKSYRKEVADSLIRPRVSIAISWKS